MSLERMNAPFNDDQVHKLNEFQKTGFFHPFTCCGGDIDENPDCERQNQKGEGTLIATKDGWICPCGKYTQNWAHTFMGGS